MGDGFRDQQQPPGPRGRSRRRVEGGLGGAEDAPGDDGAHLAVAADGGGRAADRGPGRGDAAARRLRIRGGAEPQVGGPSEGEVEKD